MVSASSLLVEPTLGAQHVIPQQNLPFVKLSSNENPYGPSKKVLKVISSELNSANRYPFVHANELSERLVSKNNLASDQVLLGAGSSQLLEWLSFWIVEKQLTLVYSKPTFEILPNLVQSLGGQIESIPMSEGFEYDLDRLLEAAQKTKGVVYLVNPNNPTGTKIPKNKLKSFCEEISRHSFLILDEAYIEYLSDDESILNSIRDNPKLIVVRTFSKVYGLAGLRVGYLMSNANIVSQLKEFSVWANHSLNNVGISAAMASLDDQHFINESRSKNNRSRNQTLNSLSELKITPYPSHTNFIFFPTPENMDLRSLLAEQGVGIGQVKFENQVYARVTIGIQEEMSFLIKSLTKILQ